MSTYDVVTSVVVVSLDDEVLTALTDGLAKADVTRTVLLEAIALLGVRIEVTVTVLLDGQGVVLGEARGELLRTALLLGMR